MDISEKFDIQELAKNKYQVIVKDTSLHEMNYLRCSIMLEVETYAIEYAIFNINSSDLYDELLAFRLGQLVISSPDVKDTSFDLDIYGPAELTTDDIKFPFVYTNSIVKLFEGQRINCRLILKKGTGRMHVKWSPVSTITMIKDDTFIIKTTGCLPIEDILAEGFNNISKFLENINKDKQPFYITRETSE